MAIRRKPGRKTILNEELQTKLCDYIKVGVPIRDACHAVGIAESMFYLWQQKGLENKGRPYVLFVKAVEKAKSQSKIRSIVRIDKAANDDWRADAWLLERRFPEEFGKRDQLKLHQAEKGEPFSPPGAHARLLEEIKKLQEEKQKYLDAQNLIEEDDDND